MWPCLLAFVCGACFSNRRTETYYGAAVPPPRQEFRWSSGGLPQMCDPARAAAAPDTDLVRALFEGLTEYDAQTLAARPAAAVKWAASADYREWTFTLRPNALWSNGDQVTAGDFVRSWRRLLELGEETPHAKLFDNIEGSQQRQIQTPPLSAGTAQSAHSLDAPLALFGVQAVDNLTLRVRLVRPNPHFPELLAHTAFRPVHRRDSESSWPISVAARPASNGAFQLGEATAEHVTLERASNYWNATQVALERVKFIKTRDTESALSLYRAGDIDAVSNASLEPLVVKLLSPYRDFRRHTFGALVYYSFNMTRAPLTDRRVREALAIAVNRERLCADIMDGATEPAAEFLPDWSGERRTFNNARSLQYDAARARQLLSEAGYPGGQNFPRLKLLVNRNDQQRAVAVAVVEMWRATLGIETDLEIKPWDAYVAALNAGDFDVARRSLVLHTTDEATNLHRMFAPHMMQNQTEDAITEQTEENEANNDPGTRDDTATAQIANGERNSMLVGEMIFSEEQALLMVPAAPIYFSSSFSLVKPYVQGFHSNLLDAPSLQSVSINQTWSAPATRSAIWSVSD